MREPSLSRLPESGGVGPLYSSDPEDWHIGRSFSRPGHLEETCPCANTPCGLVSYRMANEIECPEHALGAAKTIRTAHRESDCPGHLVA